MSMASASLVISVVSILLVILALRNKPSAVVNREMNRLRTEVKDLKERVEKCESDRADLRDENFRLRSRIEKLERKTT